MSKELEQRCFIISDLLFEPFFFSRYVCVRMCMYTCRCWCACVCVKYKVEKNMWFRSIWKYLHAYVCVCVHAWNMLSAFDVYNYSRGCAKILLVFILICYSFYVYYLLTWLLILWVEQFLCVPVIFIIFSFN